MHDAILYPAALLAVTGGVTILLRALPFLCLGAGGRPRPLLQYIGNILSPAAIAMLAVYCLAAGVENAPRALSIENAAAAAGTLTVVLLQYWKRNPLVSILCGTAVNMILLQCFA